MHFSGESRNVEDINVPEIGLQLKKNPKKNMRVYSHFFSSIERPSERCRSGRLVVGVWLGIAIDLSKGCQSKVPVPVLIGSANDWPVPIILEDSVPIPMSLKWQ